VEASRDSSDLIRQYTGSSGYDVGRTYQLDLRIKGFIADGSRFSKSFKQDVGDQWQIDWGVGLSSLHGRRIKLETLSGQVVTLNAQDVDATVFLKDFDNQIDIGDLAKFNAPYGRLLASSGQGSAMDVGMVLHHAESGLSAEMAIADLLGSIDWSNLPNNVANISTANKYYDANGYVHFNASASQTSSYQSFTQYLDPKLWLAANYANGEYELQGATSYTSGYLFPQLGLKYIFDPQWAGSVDHDFRFNSTGLALRNQWFHLGVHSDSLSLDTAKAYGVNVGVNINFH